MIAVITLPYRIARWTAGLFFKTSLYLIWLPGDWYIYFRKVKFGISTDVQARLSQIKYQTGLEARVLCSFPLPFARMWEQGLLHFTRDSKAEMPDHSGKNEWRYSKNYFTVGVVVAFMWAFHRSPCDIAVTAAMLLICPLPVDYSGLFWMVVALSYAFLTLIIYTAWVALMSILYFV